MDMDEVHQIAMILIDDRGHEPKLKPYFDPYGIEVQDIVMDAGDIMFAGNGPDGTVSVLMERKRIDDLAASIRSDRLGGFQIDGLLEADYAWIVVEGIYRPSKDGLLEVMRGGSGFRPNFSRMMYSEVQNFLTSMQLICGIRVMRTTSPEETAHSVVCLFNWFQKDWNKHKAHKGVYAPVPERNSHKATMVRRKPSLAVKIAAQLPHVDQKAWEIADFFHHDVSFMVGSGEETWKQALGIKGKKSKVAKEIVEIFGSNHLGHAGPGTPG